MGCHPSHGLSYFSRWLHHQPVRLSASRKHQGLDCPLWIASMVERDAWVHASRHWESWPAWWVPIHCWTSSRWQHWRGSCWWLSSIPSSGSPFRCPDVMMLMIFLGFCHGLILRYPKLGLIVWFSCWWIDNISHISIWSSIASPLNPPELGNLWEATGDLRLIRHGPGWS